MNMLNDEIIHLIGKIRERYDLVYESSDHNVRIEVDLLRADIRELYEKISLLTRSKPPAADLMPPPSNPEIRTEIMPLMVEPVSESEFSSGTESGAFTEHQVTEESFLPNPKLNMDTVDTIALSTIFPESTPEILSPSTNPPRIIEIETTKLPAPPIFTQTPVPSPASKPAPAGHVYENTTQVHSTLDLFGAPASTLADKFRNENRSINEKLNLEITTDKSLGSKLRLKITDLHASIGINDRFIFINELFEGDMRMYDDMLVRLNTCTSLQEAIDVYNQDKALQGWSDQLNSVERLLDFIHRRYD